MTRAHDIDAARIRRAMTRTDRGRLGWWSELAEVLADLDISDELEELERECE